MTSDADKRLRFVIEYPEAYAHSHAQRCYCLTTIRSPGDPIVIGFNHEKYRMFYEEGLRMAAECSNYRYGECCSTCKHCTHKLCSEGDCSNIWTHCQEHGYINVHLDGKCDLYISDGWKLDEDDLSNLQDE